MKTFNTIVFIFFSLVACGQTCMPPHAGNFLAREQAAGVQINAKDLALMIGMDAHLCGSSDGTGLYVRSIDSLPVLDIMYGSTSTSQQFNFISSSYSITYYGSPTINSTGVTFNGTTNYASTNFNPGTIQDTVMGIGLYIRNARASSSSAIDMGGTEATGSLGSFLQVYTPTCYFAASSPYSSTTSTSSKGYWFAQRINQTQVQLDLNGVLKSTFANTYNSSDLLAKTTFIGCDNANGTPAFYAADNVGSAWITNGGMPLTMRQSFYNALLYFNVNQTVAR